MISDQARLQHQQTIKLAIDCETGELVPAESLLTLEEEKFSALRRAAMAARVERRRGGNAVRFVCAICKQPVFLSRYVRGTKNRWFAHDGKSEQCPWYEKNRLTPDQTKALIYRGQQEGAQHRAMKQFLAQWLAKEPAVVGIDLEQTTFSEVVKGEWRRPDVKCQYRGIPLVFEIQLSYVFLSDVIARDQFYQREGIYIVWVFATFDQNRAAITDEAFFNRRNLFVLDAEAMRHTIESKILSFSGYRQMPRIVGEHIRDFWTSELINLGAVTFPTDIRRPYFFDYEAERRVVEAQQVRVWQERQLESWISDVQEYLDIATRYYDSDHDTGIRTELLAKVDRLSESWCWHQGFEALRSMAFCGWHGVLPVLLSIKADRPVGYSVKSVYQVIEAGLRTGYHGIGKHAFAILYMWAYKAYKPTVTDKNRNWLIAYSHEIKRSLDAGEDTYRRFTGYDEAISLLFPELEELLASTFGCGPANTVSQAEAK